MSAIDVVLLERIESLGQMGDVVKVKPGFARNFLLPQKKALRATKANMEYFEKQRAQLEANNLKRKQDAEAVSKKLEGLSVVIIRQAGETGQLYGSVAARDIAEAVTQAGFTVDRRQILLDQPIKTLGVYKTRVALHPEVVVGITANVALSTEEAEAQAKAAAAPAAPAEAPEVKAEEVKPEAEAKPEGEAKPKKAKKKADA